MACHHTVHLSSDREIMAKCEMGLSISIDTIINIIYEI